MEELLELALKKIDVLEKKLERYYSLLKIDNELDFILNGSYILQTDFDNVMSGTYWLMNNLETLKQELLSQKSLIEQGGGYVIVSGTNPSPSEITAGIKTIMGSDLTIATATEEDVRVGKTFFAGGSELRTGIVDMDTEAIHHIFMAPQNVQSSDKTYYYNCPDNINFVKRYCFEFNHNKIQFRFSDSIEYIREYAFYQAKNMTFENLYNLTKLKRIYSNAFAYCNGEALELNMLPNSITVLDESSFLNVVRENGDIKIPDNTTETGGSVFKTDTRRVVNSIDVSTSQLKSINTQVFYNLACNGDLICPPTLTSVSYNVNYNGTFRNIVFPPSLTLLANYCFGATTSNPLSQFHLKTVVFEGETPPKFGTSVFATQHITNGVKIYVPDVSVDAYKTASNFTAYANVIYPMSQKE